MMERAALLVNSRSRRLGRKRITDCWIDAVAKEMYLTGLSRTVVCRHFTHLAQHK